MKFQVKPVLQQMADLYEISRGPKRFDRYLSMLQGKTKGDMVMPIAGYNPMGNAHVQQRIQELISLEAETLIADNLSLINSKYSQVLKGQVFDLVVNLSDDLGGAWTNRFTSHYTNTFNFGPIAKRNFCIPYFWTSDQAFSESMIIIRMQKAIFRTIYFLKNGKPTTLEDHVLQEAFVNRELKINSNYEDESLTENLNFYKVNKDSKDYNLIFNFFYGDEAAAKLNYRTYGFAELNGFQFAGSL